MGRAQLKIRFRKDRDLWEVDYRDHSGRRHRPVFATEEQAHQHATEVFRELDQPAPPVADRNITLRDYAARWLADIALEKDPNTVRGYTDSFDNHLLPALGHRRLRNLHRQHIKALLLDKRREGYAKNSVRLMKAALSVLLSDAVDDGIIAANPALQLGRRKVSRADKLTAAERVQKIRPMTWEQRDAFLAAAGSERRHAALFAILAKGGLRPGEAFALKPGDLDLRARTIRVERAWNHGRIKPTKTYEERVVDLTPEVATTLHAHFAWLKTEALRCGWGESEWLFPNEEGKPADESRVRKIFKRALKTARLPEFRLYDLRHTYASLLLAAGAPITYVSAQLGHANAATTLRYYAKWIPSKGRRWADLLDRVTETIGAAIGELASGFGTKKWNQKQSATPGVLEVADSFGGPSRTRTLDPLIKSQLLYQLS
jgi:integrase